jgi:AAA family ATP:ADP antiporter
VLYYVFTAIAYGLLNSQFWLLANHLLDPREAKRLFALIGSGALVGGIFGGQIARFASRAAGTGSVLLVAAGLLLAGVALLARLGPSETPGERRPPRRMARPGPGAVDGAAGGLRTIARSPLLSNLTLLVVLTVMAAQIVDLQFNAAVEGSTTGLDQRTAFFGNFYSVMGVAALVFQLAFTSRIHRSLGIGFGMRVLPGTVGAGTLVMLAAAVGAPGLLVWVALGVKLGESGLRYSLDQATRELLFLPVPARERVRAKAFIDVFVQRAAKGLAALLLLPVSFGVLSVVQAGWITLALVIVWLLVIGATSRDYVGAFRRGLESRTVDVSIPIDLSDTTTLELLLETLSSADARQVLHSLDILAANEGGRMVPPLLLYHDDARVRRRTLQILAQTGRTEALPLVERALHDSEPQVRAEAVRVLARLRGTGAAELMLPRLAEADPAVRAAAVACLANLEDETTARRAGEVLMDLLRDADSRVRCEAARALGAVHEPHYQGELVGLLYDPDLAVVREAVAAIRRRVARDGFRALYVPSLVSRLHDRRVR